MDEEELGKHNEEIRNEINNLDFSRPHVVILGAGASLAALPSGDRRGKKLPLMNNFIEVLELEPLIRRHGFTAGLGNFEKFYSEISQDSKFSDLVSELENQIYSYFSQLELPDHPTIYDHLVLSLREKDVIATFNWDPFLCQAYARNRLKAPMPTLLFLHGNVFVGFCEVHTNAVGHPNEYCPICKRALTKTKLLYPVSEKNYSVDHFISGEWMAAKEALQEAFMVTIFGYGAPTSDVEAIKLLTDAWTSNSNREFLETEFIDVKPRHEIESTWEKFYFSHHYLIANNFYSSEIPNHPRRTCEAMWQRIGMAKFIPQNPLPREAGFKELNKWFGSLIHVERALKK